MEATRDSPHGFTKGKSRLTNVVAFCNGTAALVDKGRATGIICLDFCKASDTIPCYILVSELKTHAFGRWTTLWTKTAGWSDSKSCSQQLKVQVDTRDELHSSRTGIVTGTI